MLVVTKVYDDKSAVLFDIDSMMSKRLTFEQIRHHDGPIIGVTSYNNEILEIKPMRNISFPTEQEALEYCQDNPGDIRYIQGYWWLIVKNNEINTVDYYVYTQVGEEITYVSKSGYTPYIQSAKIFNEVDAIKTARAMTKNSNTGKYWKIKRVDHDE